MCFFKNSINLNLFTMCFYLQDSIHDEEFQEKEITISRPLVNIKYSSMSLLGLKSHSNIVEHAKVDSLKLQVGIPKVLNGA